MFDAGILTVYATETTEAMETPPRESLRKKLAYPYELHVTGVTRYYEAARVGQRIDMTVRVPNDRQIKADDIAHDSVTDAYCIIRRVTPRTDRDGLPVLEIDLESADSQIRTRFGVRA